MKINFVNDNEVFLKLFFNWNRAVSVKMILGSIKSLILN